LSTDPAYAGTLNRATGLVTLAFPVIAATPVFYYPGLPVMGLKVLEQQAINDEGLLAFDTRYSYIFDIPTQDFAAANQFVTTNTVFIWEGSDSDLFWTTNYFEVLWATNNIPGLHAAVDADAPGEGDGIRWYNPVNSRWSNFNPQLDAGGHFLLGSLLIVAYKDRLICLNTNEGTTLGGLVNFGQRARWSQNGTPFYVNAPASVGTDATAWRSDIIGKGGFIDAPTQEVIISCEFIKDTLVVYFERSTWQLVYNNNELLPFVWQKINTELGCESTFSVVPFDRGIFAVGNYGIITTDSVNVVRIDQKIPDEVFQIQNLNDGVKRVVGIRDYNAQLVYWTFPIQANDDSEVATYQLKFPNQVLVYNYLDGSWAEFDDTFTTFGYWQKFNDITWAMINRPWETTSYSWNSQVLQARYPDVIAGNQRGFVVVFSQLQELGQNSPSLEISNIVGNVVTCPDHNLINDAYILITGSTGFTSINNQIFRVVNATSTTFGLDPAVAGVGYTGGAVVTHLPNIAIQTKQFNPFYETGKSVRVGYIDLYADRTTDGQIQAGFYTNSNTSVPVETSIMLTSPEPVGSFSATQTRIWHRIYSNCFGSFFQNLFSFNDSQMRNLSITTSNVKIHGLIYYINPVGRLSYDV
jgi:hypothetical protein